MSCVLHRGSESVIIMACCNNDMSVDMLAATKAKHGSYI